MVSCCSHRPEDLDQRGRDRIRAMGRDRVRFAPVRHGTVPDERQGVVPAYQTGPGRTVPRRRRPALQRAAAVAPRRRPVERCCCRSRRRRRTPPARQPCRFSFPVQPDMVPAGAHFAGGTQPGAVRGQPVGQPPAHGLPSPPSPPATAATAAAAIAGHGWPSSSHSQRVHIPDHSDSWTYV